PHDVQGAHDRVSHAPAGLADRGGNGGEEAPAQPGHPAGDHQPEHGDQGNQRHAEGERAEARHHPVHGPPANDRLHAAARAGPRRDMRTRRRAAMLSATVTAKRIRPRAASAEVCSSSLASANSFAIPAGSEYPGAKSDARMVGEFPITIVTAMVSPRARPRPSMVAPTMPARA